MILVTGGTGLVGAHLLLQVTASESQVRALFRTEKSIAKTKALFQRYDKEAQFEKIQWVQGDIIDIPSLEKAFPGITYVYHCAALISYDPKDEDRLRKINIEGTANMVNLSLDFGIQKFCHVSSIAALGDVKPNETTINETTEWNPEVFHSDYAISKYGAEMEIWRGQQEGLNVIIVNPGVIFGAGFNHQSSGVFFSKVKKGFPFYTHGSTGFVSVTDVVTVMIALMNSSVCGERFALVAENLTFKEVIYEIAKHYGVKPPTFEAKPWLLAIAWRLDWLTSTVFGTKRRLSKYSANALFSTDMISNQKIKNPEISGLHFDFQNITEVIQEVINKES
ncbi:NAD-dependent epimerase/dehydratase family protein [Flavobacterium sp.]|uniref:NAD-dependent epimerase/dehydratase family protein n=1 Tax=Flavobacterium sp. TaxID=239 RepID=UPI002FDD8DFB